MEAQRARLVPWLAPLLVLAVWTGLYLCHLGTDPLRGEEPRRVFPAREMIATGDWIVPHIAGEIYANKPPLINWLIAASFLSTGQENEWSARLPSALALLAFSLFALRFLRPLIGRENSLAVALAFLAAAALIDKGRTAEIEPVFITLTGTAFFLWIRYWAEGRSPWLLWTLPYLFLGIACLAKGPVHLLFWFPVILCVLHFGGRKRSVFHPAHLAGLAVMLACFLPWSWLNSRRSAAEIAEIAAAQEAIGIRPNAPPEPGLLEVWREQIALRLRIEDLDWGEWLLQPVEMLVNFLPWTLVILVALWKGRELFSLRKPGGKAADGGDLPRPADPGSPPYPGVDAKLAPRIEAVVRGILWASLLCGALLFLLPEAVPRYLMPLFAPLSLLAVLLHARMPESLREKFDRWSGKMITGGLFSVLLLCLAGPVVLLAKKMPLSWAGATAALAVTAGFLVWRWKRGAPANYFVDLGTFLALGVFAATALFWPARAEERSYRELIARVEESLPADQEPATLYVDDRFHGENSWHLRYFFHLDPRIRLAGPNVQWPEGPLRILHRTERTKQLRRRLKGRHLEIVDRFELGGLPFRVGVVDR